MANEGKIGQTFKAVALVSFNTLLVFAALNLALLLVFEAKDRLVRPHRQPMEALAAVYPGMDEAEIEVLVRETWSRAYSYEPWTESTESAFAGRYVNVDSAGFRLSRDQGPWPPGSDRLNVFLFGGSTTFGYGLPDGETIASYLQAALSTGTRPVSVYNFGRGHYFSTQERILFETLLAGGMRPDVAVFIDGLNEFSHPEGMPYFARQFREFVNNPGSVSRVLARLPVVRVFGSLAILARRGALHEREVTEELLDDEIYIDPALVERVSDRYLKNKRLIEAVASSFGVETLFVWQPIPTYNYSIENHLFRRDIPPRQLYARAGYRSMRERVANKGLSGNFLWSADLQLGRQKPLYVDAVHYGAELSGLLATTIADELQLLQSQTRIQPE